MFKLEEIDNATYRILSIKCKCGHKIKFTDFAAPIACINCGDLLPDALELRFGSEKRVAYHLDKDLFD